MSTDTRGHPYYTLDFNNKVEKLVGGMDNYSFLVERLMLLIVGIVGQ